MSVTMHRVLSAFVFICVVSLQLGSAVPLRQPVECIVTAQIGCFVDAGEHADKRERVLKEQVEDANSLEDCAANCAAHGFGDDAFKGVEYGSQCYCGHEMQGHPSKQPDSDCSMPCKETKETCGGKYRLQVFNSSCGSGPVPPPGPAPSPPTPGPSPTPTPPPPGHSSVCDVYAAGGTACVAAYSSTRALYGSFSGALYEVRRLHDSATTTIGVMLPGGIANISTQDTFCERSGCVISRLFDQSGNGNHLGIFHKDQVQVHQGAVEG